MVTSHARHVLLVTEISHIDIHGRAGLVGLCIMDKEHF
jgi:hypothetical protein